MADFDKLIEWATGALYKIDVPGGGVLYKVMENQKRGEAAEPFWFMAMPTEEGPSTFDPDLKKMVGQDVWELPSRKRAKIDGVMLDGVPRLLLWIYDEKKYRIRPLVYVTFVKPDDEEG